MPSPREALRLLGKVLSDEKRRKEHILHFQDVVWNRPDVESEGPEWDILGNLAIDLAYYVRNPQWRRESPSYFGEKELEALIGKALSELEVLGFSSRLSKLDLLDGGKPS